MPQFSPDSELSPFGVTPIEMVQTVGALIQDAVLLIDANHQIVQTNQVASRIFETTCNALIGTSVNHWLPAYEFATGATVKEAAQGVLQVARHSDGTLTGVSVRRSAFGSGANRHEILIIVQQNELNKLQKQLQRHTTLMNHCASPCLIQGATGQIEVANHAFETVFGYAQHEVIGRVPREIIAGELTNLDEIAAGFASVMVGGSVKRDEAFYRKDGSLVWVSYEQHAVTNDLGDVSYIVTTATDISDRIEAEKMKSDFVSMVGHELRAPLTVVSGTIEVLDDPRFVTLPAEVKEILLGAKRGCTALNMLIGDLVDISKIEAGVVAMQPEPVDVASCAANVHNDLRAQANARGITLHAANADTKHPEVDQLALVDPDRLRQILTNLTSNAIKYGSKDGNVWTRIEYLNGTVVISISDDGPGIDEGLQTQLFEKFTRAPDVAAKGIEGFGLGLSICKGLTEQMGGILTLVSNPGTGACFRVTLPTSQTKAPSILGSTAPAV